MTREEILAIRATGLALVAQCDAALAREVDAHPAVLETSTGGTITLPTCEHLKVVSTAVSGAPFRAKCVICGQSVERAA